MQASELVTDETLVQALAGYERRVWGSEPLASFEQAMRAALEAVALDLYERGLRDAAGVVKTDLDRWDASLQACDPGSGNERRVGAKCAALLAAYNAILSKLRSAT